MQRKRNYRLLIFVLLLADMCLMTVFGVYYLKKIIPDTIYIRQGQETEVSQMMDYPFITYSESIDVSKNGSYQIPCYFLNMIYLKDVQVKTEEEKWVDVCGMPIGLYMETQGVLVVDTGEITGKDGVRAEPAEHIAKAGDYILEVNGNPISGKKELIKNIEASHGETMELLVNRNGEKIPLSISPVLDQNDEYKLGLWIRDNTQGIGTMTYVDENGKFGALGHGISDADTGELLNISEGELYEAEIVSIKKGTKGMPGELSGYIDYDPDKKIGIIEKNTELGISGEVFDMERLPHEKVMVGYQQEVKEGKAKLLTNLNEEVKVYDIEITEIYRNKSKTNKAFEIQVTDPRLLEETGGIVQGMSGSPILQNGKLIGAVTHVFVQDSSKGYGIFIENML
ncbi:SpoIVB peptidase [Blautia sp. Marseille-P3201T]|uniref:SpoIVB peptidase n=1 Tax=Blautia sp. Marseille-P3201T TaxID=1907659 RepID=UPI0009306139|nr:SpoIVB peptidase [Blautia sp. Marseille-P3201T]